MMTDKQVYNEQSNSYSYGAPPPSYGEANISKNDQYDKLSLQQQQQQHLFNDGAGPSRLGTADATDGLPRIRCKDGRAFPPIVIPQLTATVFWSPFARAYAPDLHDTGIDKARFIRFIDELNEVFVMNPVLQCVSLAGEVTGYVPGPITGAVGTGVEIAVGVTDAAAGYKRIRAFVKRSNEELFMPHGMRVRILSTDKMLKAIGEPDLGAPTRRRGLNMPPLPTPGDATWDPHSSATDPRLRRIEALQGRIAPLDWNVPSRNAPTSMVGKMGAWQVKRQVQKEREKYEKMVRKAGRSVLGGARSGETFDDRARGSSSIASTVFGSSSPSDDSDSDSTDYEAKREKLYRKIDHVQQDAETRALEKAHKAGEIHERCQQKVADLTKDIDRCDRKLAKRAERRRRKSEKAIGKIEKRERKHNQRVRWVVVVPDDGTSSSGKPVKGDLDLTPDDDGANDELIFGIISLGLGFGGL